MSDRATPGDTAPPPPRKRVLVVCQLDRVSNGVKPVEIKTYLERSGHDAELVNTYYLSRASARGGTLLNKLPSLRPRRLGLYAVELASLVLTRHSRFARRRLSYYLLRADQILRRSLLRRILPVDGVDLIICETPHDAELLTVPMRATTLYDAPTPWADELYDDGKLTAGQHRRMRAVETRIFEAADHLAFWWPSYARHVIAHYGYRGENLITLNYGCSPRLRRARFGLPLRVVYIGSLTGIAINLPQLARLAKLYPHIDVYGGPPPDPALGLNYLGWATPDVLEGYQCGLITSSDHELRKNGFSAKHPQYLAYGLPVLVPASRRHLDLLQGSVPYDETTFLDVIRHLSDEDTWQRASDVAYEQARELDWSKTLRPLDDILRGVRGEISPLAAGDRA